MGHYEIEFPLNFTEGATGGPGTDVGVVRVDSGAVNLIPRRNQFQRVYNAAQAVTSQEDAYTLLAFWQRVGGPANSFLVKDPQDYTSVGGHHYGDASSVTIGDTDQVLGTGDGSETDFQIIKTYGSTAPTHVRTIRKPVSGTVVIALDGTPTASGWSVDTTTGVVTFTAAPGAGVVVSAGYEFRVPVRFAFDDEQVLEQVFALWDGQDIPRIPLEEVLSPAAGSEWWNPGGAATHDPLSANVNLSLAARYWTLAPDAGSLEANLPAKANLATGPDVMVIYNASGSYTVTIKDIDTAATVATLGTGVTRRFALGLTSGGGKVWRAH